jgi:hypothetical protein
VANYLLILFLVWLQIGAVKKEDAIDDAWLTYVAQKKFANQAVMQFAAEHPEIDITSCTCLFRRLPASPPLHTHNLVFTCAN